jgi:hypothetical protein
MKIYTFLKNKPEINKKIKSRLKKRLQEGSIKMRPQDEDCSEVSYKVVTNAGFRKYIAGFS